MSSPGSSSVPSDVPAIVDAELRQVLATDRSFEAGAVLCDIGVSSLKLMQLASRVGLRLGLAGDPPATAEIKTVGDIVTTFERQLAAPREDDLSLTASVTRAQRRLRLRGAGK